MKLTVVSLVFCLVSMASAAHAQYVKIPRGENEQIQAIQLAELISQASDNADQMAKALADCAMKDSEILEMFVTYNEYLKSDEYRSKDFTQRKAEMKIIRADVKSTCEQELKMQGR